MDPAFLLLGLIPLLALTELFLGDGHAGHDDDEDVPGDSEDSDEDWHRLWHHVEPGRGGFPHAGEDWPPTGAEAPEEDEASVTDDDPGAERWSGPIVFRGMSRSGMMHTMVGHGALQKENCAAYGYGR